ncbi:hypothetical protein N9P53_04970 [Flavobacteriaceae bacterium]|jgi:hypothetical protein|nr:hypothetical protein [Flavobacteriaceae bacterium]|tara:strand:- start:6412 stop:7248 length:837 start_codon:yes stop_codon:yes gene_type:complete
MKKKEEGIDKKQLSWFMRIITLGDRFSVQDFYDRIKKGFVEFLIVFFGVLVSFGVESQGEDFGDRESNIDNLVGLRNEMQDIHSYTEDYIYENQWTIAQYKLLYDQWDDDNENVFILLDPEDEEPYSPLSFYNNYNPFNPPRVVYESIKLDGTFRFLGSKVGRFVNDTYDGTDLKYLILNTDREEKVYVDQFEARVANKWIYELEQVDLYEVDFWIKNRKYIQSDRFLRYNLFKRLVLWGQIAEQLEEYDGALQNNIRRLDSVIKVKEDQFTFIYWWW